MLSALWPKPQLKAKDISSGINQEELIEPREKSSATLMFWSSEAKVY